MKKFIKQRLREQMIDGQNMNQGTQTACNTMSVATYKEGLQLIINAIGHPNENPKMWSRISKPLHNWQQEDVSIGNEVKSGGMSGDSMVDESNTWWAAIQSTICEQGNNGLNENYKDKEFTPQYVYDYINKMHRNGWEKRKFDDAEWVLNHKYFVLKDINLNDPIIKWNFGQHPPVVANYSKLITDLPPIVVGSNGFIIDGTHRAGAAKLKGDKTIKAFIGY